MYLRNAPLRLATGAFILHSGYEKWGGGQEQAEGIHGMASGAFPALEAVDPPILLRGLAAAEMALGTALLAPTVSSVRAGTALTAFSGGLLALYYRTPGMRKPNSIWPTPEGIGVSKDVWMLSIGLSLILGGAREKAGDVVGSVKDTLSRS